MINFITKLLVVQKEVVGRLIPLVKGEKVFTLISKNKIINQKYFLRDFSFDLLMIIGLPAARPVPPLLIQEDENYSIAKLHTCCS